MNQYGHHCTEPLLRPHESMAWRRTSLQRSLSPATHTYDARVAEAGGERKGYFSAPIQLIFLPLCRIALR